MALNQPLQFSHFRTASIKPGSTAPQICGIFSQKSAFSWAEGPTHLLWWQHWEGDQKCHSTAISESHLTLFPEGLLLPEQSAGWCQLRRCQAVQLIIAFFVNLAPKFPQFISSVAKYETPWNDHFFFIIFQHPPALFFSSSCLFQKLPGERCREGRSSSPSGPA